MGNFDDLFQELAEVVTELFVETPATFRRVREVYNEDLDKDTTIVDGEVEVLITPPAPFTHLDVGGGLVGQGAKASPVLDQDLRTLVPAKSLDEVSFDPVPTSEVQVFVTTRGRTYKVVMAQIVAGGDEVALYRLQLRG